MRERYVLKKSVKKALQVILILLCMMILTKKDATLVETIKEKLLSKNLSVMKGREFYEKYIGQIPKKEEKEVSVFQETPIYLKEEKTEKGVKLTVKEHTLVPNIESGVLVYMDQGKAIVEQIDGVSAIYNNIDVKNYKIYDYLEKGDILGESSSEELLVSFEKEGEYYDYKNYL